MTNAAADIRTAPIVDLAGGQEPEEAAPQPTMELSALLDKMREALRKFIVADEASLTTATLWAANTWVYERWTKCPYLFITAPEKGSGKSTLLDLIGQLSQGPEPGMGDASAAVIFRTVEQEDGQVTLLIDEVDTVWGAKSASEGSEALRRVLNGGNSRRTGFARRADDRGTNLRKFRTYCPKAMAGIGSAVPETLLDRSIVIRLQMATRDETKLLELPEEDAMLEVTEPLAAEMAAHAPALQEKLVRPELPDAVSFNRLGDSWRPIVAIADAAGAHWPEQARTAAVALGDAQVAQAQQGDDKRFLSDIRDVFNEQTADRLSVFDLVNALRRITDAPWEHQDLDGWHLGRKLGEYEGVKRSQWRVSGTKVNGYTRSTLEPVWTRYLGDPEIEGVPTVPTS